MKVRRAEHADEEALAVIRRRAILALAGSAASAEEAMRWANSAQPDRIERAIREHEVWVAEDVAVGWVEIARDRVAGLYVAPPFAGRGIGSELLSLAEASIRGSGHAAVRLEASRNALEFYLRRGYRRSGRDLPDGSHPVRKDLAALRA